MLRGIGRRHVVQPGRADAEELEHRRHRVRGELPAARAGSRAGDALELVHVGVAHRSGGGGADRFEDVLDRDVAVAEAPRRDRAVVEHEPRQVETRERHHRRRDRLVAADDAHEAVEQVAARDELDRVRDRLARHERRAHALGPHRDAVRDRDRVELDGRAAGFDDAAAHMARELALIPVARHRLDPVRRDADERTRERVVVEPDPFQHRARGARSTPSVSAALWRLAGSVLRAYGSLMRDRLLSSRLQGA